MDLPTLRQASRERKNATEQIKNMTQLGFEPRTFGLSHRRSTNWATVSVGRTWIYPYKLSHIIKSLRRYLSLLWTLLNDTFHLVYIIFSLDVHIWFCLFSIAFLDVGMPLLESKLLSLLLNPVEIGPSNTSPG